MKKFNLNQKSLHYKKIVTQLRTDNPYQWGEGVTSHHIIPDELLNKAIGDKKVNDIDGDYINHGDQKEAIMASFLPDFENISLGNLLDVGGALVEIDLGLGFERVNLMQLYDNKYNG